MIYATLYCPCKASVDVEIEPNDGASGMCKLCGRDVVAELYVSWGKPRAEPPEPEEAEPLGDVAGQRSMFGEGEIPP